MRSFVQPAVASLVTADSLPTALPDPSSHLDISRSLAHKAKAPGAPASLRTAREPGTTTAPAGISSGASAVRLINFFAHQIVNRS